MLYPRSFAWIAILIGIAWIIQAVFFFWLTQDAHLQLLAIDTLLNDPAVLIIIGILFFGLGTLIIIDTWKRFRKKTIDISCVPSKAIEIESELLENGVKKICKKLFPNQTVRCSLALSRELLSVGVNVDTIDEHMLPLLEKELQRFFSSCGIKQQVELKLYTQQSNSQPA